MKADSIDYSHGNTKLKAYVAYDDSITGKRPAIFMVHARNGLTDSAKQQANDWSKLGRGALVYRSRDRVALYSRASEKRSDGYQQKRLHAASKYRLALK